VRNKKCDVLVVGGGAAGLRAAIAAKEYATEAGVLLVDKGEICSAGITARAQSDRMAFHATLPHTEPGEDAWKYHALDIYELGGCVSDGDLAAILARESADAFYYLDKLGLPWVKDEEGKARQFLTDGSVYPRACFTGPYTANDIHRALLARAEEVGVEFIENFMLVDLLLKEGKIFGALFLPCEGGWEDCLLIEAGAVVLATGGAGALFKETLYPPSFTGDGWAAAVRAGAELVNLEFVQLGICSKSPPLACSGSMMRAVPRFIDEGGGEFLFDEIGVKLYELVFFKGASWPVSFESETKIIDIACFRREKEGKIYLDYSRNGKGFSFWELPENAKEFFVKEAEGEVFIGSTPYQRLEQINEQVVEFYKTRGVDLENSPIEVAHAAQHFRSGAKRV